MMLRAFLLATGLSLLVAGQAQAASVPTAEMWTPRALAVAEQHWPQAYACKGRTTVKFIDQAALQAAAPGKVPGIGQLGGGAYLDLCVIVVDVAQVDAAVTLCAVLAHEAGHLAGLRFPGNPLDDHHSPNENSVMAARLAGPTTRCMYAFVPSRVTRLRIRRWRCDPNFYVKAWTCKKRHHDTLELSPQHGGDEW
jgi:hypothetical protein